MSKPEDTEQPEHTEKVVQKEKKGQSDVLHRLSETLASRRNRRTRRNSSPAVLIPS